MLSADWSDEESLWSRSIPCLAHPSSGSLSVRDETFYKPNYGLMGGGILYVCSWM
jgi:hypothetical protein